MDAALDAQKDGLGTRIYERMEGDAVSGAYKPPQASQLGEDVEKVTAAERRKKRLAHEEKKWDEEHYM